MEVTTPITAATEACIFASVTSTYAISNGIATGLQGLATAVFSKISEA